MRSDSAEISRQDYIYLREIYTKDIDIDTDIWMRGLGSSTPTFYILGNIRVLDQWCSGRLRSSIPGKTKDELAAGLANWKCSMHAHDDQGFMLPYRRQLFSYNLTNISIIPVASLKDRMLFVYKSITRMLADIEIEIDIKHKGSATMELDHHPSIDLSLNLGDEGASKDPNLAFSAPAYQDTP